ncbi:hypothetical protein [Mesorhizobium neociceri]|uniref:hypothetical protein n=1 Tax=Mesorhizobium neociceri TaxID=1307853 RepID=UPI001F3A6901|nr:hypothetical protein [Mesorhizobium neociceri]
MQTGLSREELISRITRDLAEAVNKMAPSGELPSEPTQGSNETTCSTTCLRVGRKPIQAVKTMSRAAAIKEAC